MKMNIVTRKLADLKHPPLNVRMHPDLQIKELIRSLKMHGQTRLIVIDEDNVIWIGNGLHQAMSEMGLTEAQCLLKSGMTDVEKKKMMASDNKIFDLGVDDMNAFDQLLKELGDDLDVPGFDEDLLRTLTADIGDVDEMMSSYGIIDEEKKEEIVAAGETFQRKVEAKTAEMNEMEEETISPVPPITEVQKTRECVICPKCGETIWL